MITARHRGPCARRRLSFSEERPLTKVNTCLSGPSFPLLIFGIIGLMSGIILLNAAYQVGTPGMSTILQIENWGKSVGIITSTLALLSLSLSLYYSCKASNLQRR
jgi:hypothetical protein